MPQLSRRLDAFGESVIRRMTRISDECGALNLSQGFPDFDPPKELTDELKRIAAEGPHQYSVTWGAPNFLEALAAKQRHFMGLDLDPMRHIVATCGSTEAMMVCMLTVCEPGDKVIVFSPFYENYTADTVLCGADPIYVPLHPPTFHFDRDELRRAFEQRPKALVLCNPSNPTGKVFTRDELLYIAALAEEFDTFVITDEVYEHMVYTPNVHTYFASLPGMFKRTLSCSSLSKTYSITGWRLGYVIADEPIMEVCRKVHDFLTVGAPAPLQEAVIAGLKMPLSYYEEMTQMYQQKRDFFLRGLDKLGLQYYTPQGAYYVLLDMSKFGCTDDTAFCEDMTRRVGVAAVPGSSFFREPVNNYIRLHFAKKQETLADALERLKKLND